LTPRNLSVLLIEDDPADAELLVRRLRSEGYDVTAKRVATLAEARDALLSRVWDIVLSDHSMPGFKSIDVLTVLRSIDLTTPFIIVSGAIGEQEVVDALHLGVASYVSKDNLARLTPTIERVLNNAELRRVHDATERRLKLVQAAVDNANDVILVLESQGLNAPYIAYANEAAERLWGCPPAELIGKTTAALRRSIVDRDAFRKLLDAVSRGRSATVEILVHKRDGDQRYFETTLYPIPDSNRFVSVSRDVTERKSAEQQLAFLASHDGLTGLPNRATLIERLEDAIEQARRARLGVWILFIDLDGLKAVNDSLGHAVGDELLRQAGQRMRTSLHAGDMVARVGGDEFVAVVTSVGERAGVETIAGRITEAISLMGYPVSASIGICSYPADGDEADALLRKADAALYHAKATGRRKYHFYDPSDGASLRVRGGAS